MVDVAGFNITAGGVGTAASVASAFLGGGGPKGVQRQFDVSSGGGIAVGPGHNNVKINGRPAAIPATPFTPHIGCSQNTPWHCVGVIATIGNAKTVKANGIPLVLSGAIDSCIEHSRAMGSNNVRAV